MENEKEVSCYIEEPHCAVLTMKVGFVSKNAVSFQRSTWKGCLKKPSTHIPKRLPTTSSSTQLFFGSCSQTKGLANVPQPQTLLAPRSQVRAGI